VGDVNTYLADAKKGPSIMLLRKAGDYVTRILRVRFVSFSFAFERAPILQDIMFYFFPICS
jgi:hypothetical protein